MVKVMLSVLEAEMFALGMEMFTRSVQVNAGRLPAEAKLSAIKKIMALDRLVPRLVDGIKEQKDFELILDQHEENALLASAKYLQKILVLEQDKMPDTAKADVETVHGAIASAALKFIGAERISVQ